MTARLSTAALFAATAAYSASIQAFSNQESLYRALLIGLYALIALLILNAVANGRMKLDGRIMGFVAIVIIGSQATLALYSIIFGTSLVGRDILLVPLVMMILGFGTHTDYRGTALIAYSYGAAAALSGWYVVRTYGTSAAYPVQYFFAQKNQIGAVLGAAIALLLYEYWRGLIQPHISRKHSVFTLFLIAVNLWALFQLRNRSTIVGLLILLAVLVWKTVSSPNTRKQVRLTVSVIIALVLVFLGSQLWTVLYDTLFANYDVSDLNSVSANRVEGYVLAIDFLENNLLLGEVAHASTVLDPHNFVLYNLHTYGLIASLGYLFVYIYFGYRLAHDWVTHELSDIAPWAYLLTISFSTSFFEYAQPFGPGTTQLVAWYFVGQSLRKEPDESSTESHNRSPRAYRRKPPTPLAGARRCV